MRIKGYYTSQGYMGCVEGENKYLLFSTEEEYIDYVSQCIEDTIFENDDDIF